MTNIKYFTAVMQIIVLVCFAFALFVALKKLNADTNPSILILTFLIWGASTIYLDFGNWTKK